MTNKGIVSPLDGDADRQRLSHQSISQRIDTVSIQEQADAILHRFSFDDLKADLRRGYREDELPAEMYDAALVDELLAEVRSILSAFYRSEVSMSSVQPILDLAVRLDPSLKEGSKPMTRLSEFDRRQDADLQRTGGLRHLAIHIANYCSTACWNDTQGASVNGYDCRTGDPARVTCPLCAAHVQGRTPAEIELLQWKDSIYSGQRS